MQINELTYWLTLNKVVGGYTNPFVKNPESLNNLERIFKDKSFINQIKLPKSLAEQILTFNDFDWGIREENYLKENNIKIIKLIDENYPSLLKEIYDPPLVLYVKGNLIKDFVSISIVGSRACTKYGEKIAFDLAQELSKLGITIVSGLAQGVDCFAHKGAIQAQGYTIAVLGCGVNVLYPRPNLELIKEIPKLGAIISEFPINTEPFRPNFPRRNRIISGLSKGTIIIEAGLKSGSLITAKLALSQNRSVFAVPGSIYSKVSEGTHMLIKNGASLVDSIDDIVLELFPHLQEGKGEKNSKETQSLNFTEDENKILACLSETPMHLDEIIEKSKLGVSETHTILITLALSGIIKEVGMAQYIRNN